jgi:hypothetical protein
LLQGEVDVARFRLETSHIVPPEGGTCSKVMTPPTNKKWKDVLRGCPLVEFSAV